MGRPMNMSVFTNRVHVDRDLELICITPEAPMKERRAAGRITRRLFETATDWEGGTLAWYPHRQHKRDMYQGEEPPYAFILMFNKQVAGLVVTCRTPAYQCRRQILVEKQKPQKEFTPVNPGLAWSERPYCHCIARIYVCESYRRKAIASRAVKAIARYFHKDIKNIGWIAPFSNSGFNLAWSLLNGITTDKTIYLSY